MSQHDFDIATADANTGVTVRAAINAALQALASCSSGAAAPATTYAYQIWADTTTGRLKIRNGANNGWVDLLDFATSITASNAEINKLAGIPAGLTATEIGYLDGVTSAIQGQLGEKAPTTQPTFYGSITLLPNPQGDPGTETISAAYANISTDLQALSVITQNLYLTPLSAAPASASAAGFSGDIRVTADYIYVCTADNTWKRAALSTW